MGCITKSIKILSEVWAGPGNLRNLEVSEQVASFSNYGKDVIQLRCEMLWEDVGFPLEVGGTEGPAARRLMNSDRPIQVLQGPGQDSKVLAEQGQGRGARQKSASLGVLGATMVVEPALLSPPARVAPSLALQPHCSRQVWFFSYVSL